MWGVGEDVRVTDVPGAPSSAAPSSRRPRRVVLLGSTGSIGTQALELARRNPDRFEVVGLSAGGNIELLAEQAVAFQVPVVAAANATSDELSAAIRLGKDEGMQVFNDSLYFFLKGEFLDRPTAFEVSPNVEELKMMIKGIDVKGPAIL